MTLKSQLLTITEYGQPADLRRQIVGATDQELRQTEQLMAKAGSRVASALGFSMNPIKFDGGFRLRAVDFAGFVRVKPGLNLEVIPKFLSEGDTSSWREDYFYLATLSKYGKLLSREHIPGKRGDPKTFATLAARSLVLMYEDAKLRPIRKYRRRNIHEFALDGEADPVDLLFPSENGFAQQTIVYDRRNHWSGTIYSAAYRLLSEVSDTQAISGLTRIIEDLPRQRTPRTIAKQSMPSRHKCWQPIYDLSFDILHGLGASLQSGSVRSPGFLVSTWQLWEDILRIATKLGFGSSNVEYHGKYKLGQREKPKAKEVKVLSVEPDYVIRGDDQPFPFIVDAKYKTRVDREPRIMEGDIYESLAFARAANITTVFLVYPAVFPGAEPGECSMFEKVAVDGASIIGVQVAIRGISQLGGIRSFAKQFEGSLRRLALAVSD